VKPFIVTVIFGEATMAVAAAPLPPPPVKEMVGGEV
jgi:hypothetical protein